MLEKLLLAGAVTFSVYIFSGLDAPINFRFPLAARPAEASFSRQTDNSNKAAVVSCQYQAELLPISAIANNLD